jgi:DNA-binding SARP family transcriptional activator
MWRVKRTVPGMIRSDAVGISLAPSVVVDSREQEAFATSLLNGRGEDPQWIRSGLPALQRVELLPGWYDDWVFFERERMSQLRLHALERAARIFTRHRELDTALELALEAVRAEPLRESAHAVLMTVYIAEGNVRDAVHQYDVFSELLWRELGLVPSQALARMLPREVRHPGED